jgi:xanthine dehydrogenase YagS FAD-binding subunit
LYFRQAHFLCYKKGGDRCYAAAGEHRFYHSIIEKGKCVMAHPSDMAPALIALKAKAVIAGCEGERSLPLEDFFLGPNNFRETALRPDEFLTAVEVPSQDYKPSQFFLKQRIRRAADFALSSAAVAARVSDGVCEDIRMVLGGIAPFPLVATAAEAILKGRRLDERLISEAAEASVKGARPLPMNGYKADLTKTLVRRALTMIRQER